MASIAVVAERGWEVVRLASDDVEVDVVPAKGGEILALRWRRTGLNVLWTSPWGLRHRGALAPAADPQTLFMDHYPGGWQVLFPNGGAAVVERGSTLDFHGEAALAPWEWSRSGDGIELTTHLWRSPFALRRTLTLDGGRLRVVDRARNTGGTRHQAMWSHHPAFGAPFLDESCTVAAAARAVVVDGERDTPTGDLQPGARGTWPLAPGRGGGSVDLTLVPPDGPACDRLAYLTDFARGQASITSERLGLRVELDWDERVFPHAWYWLEARATADYPWFQQAYVLAIEPASSFPGHGISSVRRAGGSLVGFDPGEEVTVTVDCTVAAV